MKNIYHIKYETEDDKYSVVKLFTNEELINYCEHKYITYIIQVNPIINPK